MKKKRRINYFRLFIFLIILIGLIAGGVFLVKEFIIKKDDNHFIQEQKKDNNNEIKKSPLKDLNYSDDDIKIINDSLSEEHINYLVENKIKSEDIIPIVKETYYIDYYLKDYLSYKKENPSKENNLIVQAVNTHINYPFYTHIEDTDESLGKFVLLNKYYKASESYKANDLIAVSSEYHLYGSNFELSKECYEAFLEMYNDAKEAGYGFKINSPYRSYQTQVGLYNKYASTDGKEMADTYSARAGHSEHQTGYAFDIRDFPYTNPDYSKTKSFTWVSKNAYKYGFILRFPKGKEYITGYQYESWHYRYVGKEAAKYIYDHDLTFEEYYEYFVKFKNPRNLK